MIDIVITPDNSGSMESVIGEYRQAILTLVKSQMKFMEDARLTLLNFQYRSMTTPLWRIPLRYIEPKHISNVFNASGGTNVMQGYLDSLALLDLVASPDVFRDLYANPESNVKLIGSISKDITSILGPAMGLGSTLEKVLSRMNGTDLRKLKLSTAEVETVIRTKKELAKTLWKSDKCSNIWNWCSIPPGFEELGLKMEPWDFPQNPERKTDQIIHVIMTDGECSSPTMPQYQTSAANTTALVRSRCEAKNIKFDQILISPKNYTVAMGDAPRMQYLRYTGRSGEAAELFETIDGLITAYRAD